MIERSKLACVAFPWVFKMANNEEDLRRALDFLAQNGFERELKKEQKSAVLQLMCGGDLLGVLPTGFGKSLIFQLLAVAKKSSIVFVICPLVSVIKDQVLEATSMGLTATAMAEAKQEDIDSGKYQLVFASAEDALQRKEFLASLKLDSSPLHNNLTAVVIDECHTIETWTGKRYRQSLVELFLALCYLLQCIYLCVCVRVCVCVCYTLDAQLHDHCILVT